MAYIKPNIKSGTCWYTYNDKVSTSGCRTDVIFGYPEVDLHGHAVFFNGSEVFQRSISGLQANLSGGSIYIF